MTALKDTKENYPEQYLKEVEEYVNSLFSDHQLDESISGDVYFAYTVLYNLDLDYPDDLKFASDRGDIAYLYVGHFKNLEDLHPALEKIESNIYRIRVYEGHVFSH